MMSLAKEPRQTAADHASDITDDDAAAAGDKTVGGKQNETSSFGLDDIGKLSYLQCSKRYMATVAGNKAIRVKRNNRLAE